MTDVIDLLNRLSASFEEVRSYVLGLKKSELQNFKETWVDGQEVMQTLHVSKRTLQSLRDSGVLPYSRINGKFYYKVSDLENLLTSNYSKLNSKGHGNK
ncbi:MAG: helix-turn-helix domain-containing protein [Cyclobacteriaceae bacterium]